MKTSLELFETAYMLTCSLSDVFDIDPVVAHHLLYEELVGMAAESGELAHDCGCEHAHDIDPNPEQGPMGSTVN